MKQQVWSDLSNTDHKPSLPPVSFPRQAKPKPPHSRHGRESPSVYMGPAGIASYGSSGRSSQGGLRAGGGL